MFSKNEIRRLSEIYDNVVKVDLESFLDSEDLDTIQREASHHNNKNKRKKGTPMTIVNLANRIIIPRDTYRHCTITLQRLYDGFDFKDWLNKIATCILFAEETRLAIGFSFLCWVPHTNERTYLFSAKALAPYQFTASSKNECLSAFNKIGAKSDSEILNDTFINSLSDNPFSKSGFCPLKIVCSYVYITK